MISATPVPTTPAQLGPATTPVADAGADKDAPLDGGDFLAQLQAVFAAGTRDAAVGIQGGDQKALPVEDSLPEDLEMSVLSESGKDPVAANLEQTALQNLPTDALAQVMAAAIFAAPVPGVDTSPTADDGQVLEADRNEVLKDETLTNQTPAADLPDAGVQGAAMSVPAINQQLMAAPTPILELPADARPDLEALKMNAGVSGSAGSGVNAFAAPLSPHTSIQADWIIGPEGQDPAATPEVVALASDADAVGDEALGAQKSLASTSPQSLQGTTLSGVSPQSTSAPGLNNAVFATAATELDTSQRSPIEPHQMRLDNGPLQMEVLKLVRQGGGQIVLELTPPDQGSYRLDLRLDTQGRAQLVVEGASDSIRTRLEQGEGGLREQFSQMGLSLALQYRQPGNEASRDSSDTDSAQKAESAEQGMSVAHADASLAPGFQRLERGLVHLYA
jgi:hypothetical protein